MAALQRQLADFYHYVFVYLQGNKEFCCFEKKLSVTNLQPDYTNNVLPITPAL